MILNIYLLCINLLAFILYGIDKYKAVHHKWRISEASLLAVSFAGGCAGALLGMLFFHHKTRKWKFRILVPAGILLWAGILTSFFGF